MHRLLTPDTIAAWMSTWGYLGIFLCVFIGNLGVPVPEETVMLAAGFIAGREILDLRGVYVVAIASAVTGDCCGYAVGRLCGQRLVNWLASHFRSFRHQYHRLQEFFHTHGSKAIFMARFITGIRFMAGPMAGACEMPFFRFLGWNVMGAVVWCSLVVTVGYLVGDELAEAARFAHSASLWVAAAAVAMALGYLFWRARGQAAPIPPNDR